MTIGSRAFDLLGILLNNPGVVVSKHDLIAGAWPHLTVDESSLRFQMSTLRKILDDREEPARFIRNVPSRGYCFVAELNRAGPAASPILAQPTSYPAPKPDIIGRDAVVREVIGHLNSFRLVTIHGPGGIGKSTVAQRVVEIAADHFDGHTILLDLSAIRDGAVVAGALASALGLSVTSRDPMPSVISVVRTMRILVVLDGCEHVIDTATEIAEHICEASPTACVLATSRESLRAKGEYVLHLAPLELPVEGEAVTPAGLNDHSALQLFRARAAAAGLKSHLSNDDAALIVEICRALDGIPLAIEIAASRAGMHGVRDTAELLDGHFRLLWRGRRSALPRHQTLHATLAWSYDLLSVPEQAALRGLSVFPGRFSIEAARAVVCSRSDRAFEVEEVIDGLVAKSMVAADPGARVAPYRLLDTTRAFAHALLVEDEAQSSALRHALYVTDRLWDSVEVESRSNATELLGDIRAALTWAYSDRGDRAVAVRLTGAIAPSLLQLSLYEACSEWTERALAWIDESERGTLVELKIQGARARVLTIMRWNSPETQEVMAHATGLASDLGDARSELRLLYHWLIFHARTGEYGEFVPLVDRMQVAAEKIGDPLAMITALHWRGTAAMFTGNQIAAQAELETVTRQQLASPLLTAEHYAFGVDPRLTLSLLLFLRGLNDSAAAVARSLDFETGDVVFACISLGWVTMVFHDMGDIAAVEEHSAQLAAKAKRYSLVPYHAVGRAFEGLVMLGRGDRDGAIACLAEALGPLRHLQYGLYVNFVGRALADALTSAGRLGEAQQLIEVQLGEARRVGAFDQAEWLRLAADVAAASGREDDAEKLLDASIDLATRQGARSWLLRAEMSLARLRRVQGRQGEAFASLTQTVALFEEGLARRDLVEASTLLAQLRAGNTGASL